MDAYEFIESEQHDTTLLARLNNPPKNLLNARMVAELGGLTAAVENDESIRALILTGAADGIFITHYDVGELSRWMNGDRISTPGVYSSRIKRLKRAVPGDAVLKNGAGGYIGDVEVLRQFFFTGVIAPASMTTS